MSPELIAILAVGVALAGLLGGAIFRAEARINDRISELETRLDDRIGKLDDRIGKLEDRVGKLEDRVGDLDRRMAHFESLLEGLREAIAGRVQPAAA